MSKGHHPGNLLDAVGASPYPTGSIKKKRRLHDNVIPVASTKSGMKRTEVYTNLPQSSRKVMAVLTLKGSQKAEQFVIDKKALKAINPINLAAKTDAAKNKPADTYSNIRGNGIKDED
ncbi:hypothetical protein D8674_019415 [Pyrus ussuriensis x Pyrus communis]|uniref:Uncharacterized protein n=1 Tax=Pyrus ussuriensis x Pyrus communis TaxID=2448454 RepID=A0A5N5G7Q7_9ROSA|nr:hypothetical protein D8674_019415 [Pyrus ussuriensis x Pyrus communis]